LPHFSLFSQINKSINLIHKITGSNAPPLKHLAEWLDKNPKFDVDPKWSPLIKDKAATFKTPVSLQTIYFVRNKV
jgi:hypothetical protein